MNSLFILTVSATPGGSKRGIERARAKMFTA